MSINHINNYTIYGSPQNIPNSRNENTNIKNENNNDFTEGIKINNQESSINIPKSKPRPILLIMIITVSALVVSAIIVPIVIVLNNKNKENTFLTNSDDILTDLSDECEIINNSYNIELDSLRIKESELKKSDTNTIQIDNKKETDNLKITITEPGDENDKNIDSTINSDIDTEEPKITYSISTDNGNDFTSKTEELPNIYIEGIPQTKYCIYSILKIKCFNLNYYPDINKDDISFEFPIEDSTKKFNCDSITDCSKDMLEMFNNCNLPKDKIKCKDVKILNQIEYKYGDDMTITNDLLSKNKNNYTIIYSFIAPSNGIYDVELSSSIAVFDPCYLYADIDYNLESAIKKGRNVKELVKRSNSTRNTDFQKTIHGSFYLEENKEYFLKIGFLKSIGLHTYNIKRIRIIPNENQNKKTFGMGYTIYSLDFQNEAFYPFYPYWAQRPNYIKVENEYCEFYYNQEAYTNNFGQRHYKGAELTTMFSTIKDGWYGYKVYFTDDYPKDVNTSIITQIFNNNRVNTWAGHLHTKGDHLWMTHRSAAYEKYETHYDFGKIDWNTWYNIIIYFKVGLNKKGNIKVWLSKNELKENEPTYDSGDIDFGFGSWIDDETLDNTKIENNGKTNQILCKFGLYTWDGGDKIIRFRNITVLEYNPVGAFNIVNPCRE